jgi:hypothetical protein
MPSLSRAQHESIWGQARSFVLARDIAGFAATIHQEHPFTPLL